MLSSSTIVVDGIGPIDTSIADLIKRLNDDGFTTLQSCSGLWDEHHNIFREDKMFVLRGYISFPLSLSLEKKFKLAEAAEVAGMRWEQDLNFFFVRMPFRSEDAAYLERLREEAAKIAVSVAGRSCVPGAVRARYRRALRKLVIERGNSLHDRISEIAWEKFARCLRGDH